MGPLIAVVSPDGAGTASKAIAQFRSCFLDGGPSATAQHGQDASMTMPELVMAMTTAPATVKSLFECLRSGGNQSAFDLEPFLSHSTALLPEASALSAYFPTADLSSVAGGTAPHFRTALVGIATFSAYFCPWSAAATHLAS